MIGILAPSAVLVTGLEPDVDDPSLLRVYVGPRYHGKYVLVDDPVEQAELHRQWRLSGHLFTNLPSDAVVHTDSPVPVEEER